MSFFFDAFRGPLPPDAGGKAVGLRALKDAGFAVPPTWSLPASAVERLFENAGGALVLRRGARAAFLREARRLFGRRFPVLVRSSALDEDLPGSAAPGVYASLLAPTLESLPGSAAACAASARTPRALAYRALSGARGPARMGLLVQPWIEAEYGGVCTLYHKQRLVVELAPGGSAPVTAGRGARWRVVYDLAARKAVEETPGAPRAALEAAAAAALLVQRELYPRLNISVELLVDGGRATLLQARPLASGEGSRPLDMEAVYRRVLEMMESFGFKDGEWALSETPPVLAYNRLGLRRPLNETLEHFVVLLRPDGARRARTQDWILARSGGTDVTVFPPRGDREKQRRIAELSRDGLLFIFRHDEDANPVERRPFESGGRRFELPFAFVAAGFSREEAAFLRRRLDRASAFGLRERLEEEERCFRRVLSGLPAAPRGAYARRLKRLLGSQVRLGRRRRAIVDAFLRGPAGGTETRGIPLLPERRVVEGFAVTHADILRARWPSFIYAAHDLEPSFLHLLGRVRAVLVSRGALGSHAAALCSEFGVPLLVETRNLSRVRTGDWLRVDLSDGSVRAVRGRRR
ncbi:MAG: PEP/pyruvate-binding domain-containing protein [Elusimicrobiota bacterium]|jgi:phosphohistidine swiveling domain-containing protein